MAKIVLYIASSLDGFIARDDGSVDWLVEGESEEADSDYGYSEFYNSIDTVIMGRKTYEQILGFGEWPYEEKRCFVCTREPKAYSDERVDFVDDPTALTVNLLDREERDIWLVGGSEIVSELLNAHLIKRITITILPIILGGGIPLFNGIEEGTQLKLRDVQSFETGYVQLSYDVDYNTSGKKG